MGKWKKRIDIDPTVVAAKIHNQGVIDSATTNKEGLITAAKITAGASIITTIIILIFTYITSNSQQKIIVKLLDQHYNSVCFTKPEPHDANQDTNLQNNISKDGLMPDEAEWQLYIFAMTAFKYNKIDDIVFDQSIFEYSRLLGEKIINILKEKKYIFIMEIDNIDDLLSQDFFGFNRFFYINEEYEAIFKSIDARIKHAIFAYGYTQYVISKSTRNDDDEIIYTNRAGYASCFKLDENEDVQKLLRSEF